ncbi:MAG: hypothetical protein GYA24_24175 [Candidatus Lokiarchaeota archaeon]|nr:hypothetical protein [Candidatus Lokiarchaeota archaeon]
MSSKKIILNTIVALMLLGWTYFSFTYFLPFLENSLGVNVAQAVDGFAVVWQFNVWVMAVALAFIIVFDGLASGHGKIEPISSVCFLAYTIVSYFIGCSILTMGLPFSAFGSPTLQVTIDPNALVALFGGGGGGGGSGMPPIGIDLPIIMIPLTVLGIVFAAFRFARAVFKSMRVEPESAAPVQQSGSSSGSSTSQGSKDFFANVRG